jgi:DNA-binding SARP family transcriptional activator
VDLRFDLLGPVRAWRGDTEVDLGSPQQRAILALLLLHDGTAVSPDQLISATWGIDAPRAANGMIRSYVSRLRSALGPVIQSVTHGYALPAASVDLTDFQRLVSAARTAETQERAAGLRAALALWKGTPLTGVKGEFAEAERVRLDQVRLAAVEDLAAADIELGRHVEAAGDLAALAKEHPFRERPRELLMLALYRSGRQAEALAVFDEVRRLLSDELGLDPGRDLREMHQRILASDPALAPAAPHTTASPAQLPPDIPFVAGRDDVLPEIVTRLTSSTMVGLVGLAGVGKTALAVHVGHKIAAEFPDGQLFVDLSVSADPLAELLRGVGVAEIPQSAAEQAALWRTTTTGKRLLIVLDDVRSGEQLKPLVPGSGGPAVLVTSRRRTFDVPYIRWIKLDGLRPDDAIALLERLVGAQRLRAELDVTRALIPETGGLPQVLTAVGARLTARPKWTIAEYVNRTRTHGIGATVRPPECHAIEHHYESALQELEPAVARAFRLVALADGDIGLDTAAALLDRPFDEAEILLEALADAHLLDMTSGDQYRYPNPVRTFARGRAVADLGRIEVEAALGRLAAYQDAKFLRENQLRALTDDNTVSLAVRQATSAVWA